LRFGQRFFRMIISIPEFGENPAKPVRIVPTAQVGEQVGEQVSEQVSEPRISILRACFDNPKGTADLLRAVGLAAVYLNYQRHLLPLLTDGLIERTIPDKPRSRLQKYRLTAKGRTLLGEADKGTEKKER
jgi:ATP-dependent DNA helicase RecG